MKTTRGFEITLATAFFALTATLMHAAPHWVETGSSFAAGTLGESGQNLHVNRNGALEVIRRYDLDGDGWFDLLFNSTHNTYNALPATLVRASTGRTLRAAELGVDGSSRVISSDLNRDGFADLVFMPNRQNVQHQRSSVIIAWGGADGWSGTRLTRQLPVNGVTSLAVGDLDDDGWPDILTLNSEGWLFGQPDGRIVRAYWGSPDGFLLTRYTDVGVPGAVEVAAGRFGARGKFSAVALTQSGELEFLSAGPAGLRIAGRLRLPVATAEGSPVKARCLLVHPGEDGAGDRLWIGTDTRMLFHVDPTIGESGVRVIGAQPATHLAFGRLDGDPWPDLVLTDFKPVPPGAGADAGEAGNVAILWAAAPGVDGTQSTGLHISNAAASAVGDLDGDGDGDLLVAVFQGATSLKAVSLALFGDGSRTLPAVGAPVETEGARDVVLARLTPTTEPVAVFANSQRRTLDDAVPLQLYWGSADGFSEETSVKIPNLSGYKSSASDLNNDGHVDLIVINGGDVDAATSARAPHAGANIYWGGPEGSIQGPGPTRFDPERRQVLRENHLGSINVADLNRDGFLDVVLGSFESAGNPDTDLVIYYGSAAGLRVENRRALRVPGRSIGCLIADYNQDGWLDIVVGSYGTNQVITFWGGGDGYGAERRTVLPYPAPVDIEAADLNGDGWLDLLVASYADSVARRHDTGTSLFWGESEGWHQARSQWLPGMTPLGLAVADLDGDGFLDIVSPHYHGELSREHLPSYIFWGSAEGYAPLRRTGLTVDSASEVVIADFDRDGRLDLAFVAHSVDAGHKSGSPVFFNDGRRFESPRVQFLPTVGAHYMWVQDIGNIRHRRYEEQFTSRVLTWAESRRVGRIEVDAILQHGARVGTDVRSAADEDALAVAPWRGVGTDAFDVLPQDRALQYRLTLTSANGDAYPVVRRVEVWLE